MKPIAEYSDMELKAAGAEARHVGRKKSRSIARIQSFDLIEPEPIDWYWPGRVALGKLSIFAGDPGVGKSQAALDLAARGSCGRPFPDGEPCGEGDAIILTSEDDPNDTIRPRLDAVGATLDRIHFFHCRVDPKGKESTPSLADVDTFADAIDQVEVRGGNVRLVIIDPLDSFLAGADAHKNAEVRDVLNPIVAMARERKFAVLGIKHLNKGKGSAAYRISDSIAFTALARSSWIFCKDPDDGDRRLFLCQKNNLGKDNGGIAYTIQTADNGAPLIIWGHAVDVDINDVLNRTTQKKDPDRIAPEQDRILGILQARAPGSVQRKELVELTGKGDTAVSNILRKLGLRGLARNTGLLGVWEAIIEPSLLTVPNVTADGSDGDDGTGRPSLPSAQSAVIQCMASDDGRTDHAEPAALAQLEIF